MVPGVHHGDSLWSLRWISCLPGAALRSSWVSEMGRALGHSPEEDSMMPVPCEKHSEYE